MNKLLTRITSIERLKREPWSKARDERMEYIKRRNKGSNYIKKPEVRLYIFKRDNYTCQICGTKENPTIDHIIAIYYGGSPDDDDNLRLLCRSCNSRVLEKPQ